MRDVLDRFERMRLRWYITGSEALGRYGEPRFSADLDVVVDTDSAGFSLIASGLEGGYLVGEPIDFGGHLMASLISITQVGKIDVILDRTDPWSRSAMERRERWEHPTLGHTWVITLEDLIIAKLTWSQGTSELQLRDCRNLVRVNEKRIDWGYLTRWATSQGVSQLLDQVRRAP
jgi:hypothetical protein